MSSIPGLFLSLLCTVAFLFHIGESVQCWVCSSDIDPSCADPFNSTWRFLLTDCDREKSHTPYLQSTAVCRKHIHKAGGQRVVVRSCSLETGRDEDGPCSPHSLPVDTQVEYCTTCHTDRCNAAPALAAPTALAFFFALTAGHHFG